MVHHYAITCSPLELNACVPLVMRATEAHRIPLTPYDPRPLPMNAKLMHKHASKHASKQVKAIPISELNCLTARLVRVRWVTHRQPWQLCSQARTQKPASRSTRSGTPSAYRHRLGGQRTGCPRSGTPSAYRHRLGGQQTGCHCGNWPRRCRGGCSFPG